MSNNSSVSETNLQADQDNPAVSKTSEGCQRPAVFVQSVWSVLLNAANCTLELRNAVSMPALMDSTATVV